MLTSNNLVEVYNVSEPIFTIKYTAYDNLFGLCGGIKYELYQSNTPTYSVGTLTIPTLPFVSNTTYSQNYTDDSLSFAIYTADPFDGGIYYLLMQLSLPH
jgi:hypothetical protein